ncbi:helix-turn-helix transcriptional regulator [Nocardia huaxiensis]|uniref:Helix-turn-helix domain-containing protein n=1 Tax=Nocardia huaxiensis TaxID=2755382 RepID=A0A7D6VF07_9NOCA|nr:helix-turn-helix transcriptional regulator [Nocardia huaxiensis]QLY33473.1 helix-turn-helix domain-containing protein [Nocardia huaxiensis]UFS99616.1 helix-turn-helix transcriptional regulator [Nocardia huaxiensis]
MHKKESPAGDALSLPTFGSVLRRLRDARGISRERLARSAHLSASYVAHLELDDRDRKPTRTVVEALIGCLDEKDLVSDADRRHLYDLAGLTGLDMPTVDDLRASLSAGMRQSLIRHEPNPAAYLDTRSNVLACNAAYGQTFTGILDNGSILRWVFADERSKHALVEWEREAYLTVSLVRGFIGRSDNPKWWAETLEDLSRFPEFRRIWEAGDAGYGRETPRMVLRDAETGATRTIDLQLFQVDSVEYHDRILFVVGMPADPVEE